MRTLTAALVALLLLGLVEAGPKENEEPPQLFTLQIEGGGQTAVRIDKPFTAMIDGKPVTMKLTASPHRFLEVAGVSLHYPRSFTFAYKLDDGTRTWTLGGPFTTIVLVGNEVLTPEEFLKGMEGILKTQLGSKGKVSDVRLEIPGRVLSGRRLAIGAAGRSSHQDLYTFKAGVRTYILIIHDWLTDEGQSTPATLAVFKLLSKTLRIK
ncbi:MAG: hypothetical protein V3T86_14685 [Planctomycetota bacterium]